MVAQTTAAYGFDVVDLHYWMTHQIHKRMPDGIHWTRDAVRLQLNIILTHFCLSRKLTLPGRWGGARNRPLESAEMIAKAADEGPVEIVKEDGGKRKGREEDEEPPAKKVRVERSYGIGMRRVIQMRGWEIRMKDCQPRKRGNRGGVDNRASISKFVFG